jgi:hypothetical protein
MKIARPTVPGESGTGAYGYSQDVPIAKTMVADSHRRGNRLTLKVPVREPIPEAASKFELCKFVRLEERIPIGAEASDRIRYAAMCVYVSNANS